MLAERSPSSSRALVGGEPTCSPDCSRYKGTFDVFNKVVRQVSRILFEGNIDYDV